MTDLDLDAIGETEVRHCLARGDYHTPIEISVINKWLQIKDRENIFLKKCRDASISSALDASKSSRQANYIAIFAVMIALISNYHQINSFFELVLNFLKSK